MKSGLLRTEKIVELSCDGRSKRQHPLLTQFVENGVITSFVLGHVRVDRFGEVWSEQITKRITHNDFVNVSVGAAWVVAVSMPIGFRFSDISVHPEHPVVSAPHSECASI